jgi:PAS domain S-box-containing protein
MRIRRVHSKDKAAERDKPAQEFNDQTRSALNSAIVNIVQAIGSKAGVLTFWDEPSNTPGQFTSYGLAQPLLDDLKPVIIDLVTQLHNRVHTANGGHTVSRSEDMLALQADLPTAQGPLHIICLPIQADDHFIAGLCLLQPSVATFPLLGEAVNLPGEDPVAGSGVIPERGEDDSFVHGHYGLTQDRSDLVARNASLLKRMVEERQWLGLVIEYSADGILIVDSQCNIVGFNPAFSRISGWSVEELRGRNCYEALQISATRGEAHCGKLCPIRLGTFVNKPEEDRRSEVVILTKDGERRDLELTYSVILSSDNRILGGILGARDITARKEAEELQSTFLSVISHELQTPIAIIKGYAGLYADATTPLEPAKVREKMQIIEEESERLSKLVDNLLYASRLQAGGVELNREPLDIASLLRRVANKMRGVSKVHKISLNLPPEELPAVSADYDKIEQVVINLIENAVKYSPAGGPIILEAAPTSEEVIVKVTDRGIGVPEGERRRIFERFSRLDSRYVRERKGAGLGLYICKAIVEAHGGRIWVEPASGPEGKPQFSGSSFNFSLPRQEPANLPVLFGRI